MKFEVNYSRKWPFKLFLYAYDKPGIEYLGEFENKEEVLAAAKAYKLVPKEPEYFEI